MILKKRYFLAIMLILFLSLSVNGAGALTGADPQITGIEVRDVNGTTEIEIKSNAPFTYTIYRQADPYHFIVDLQNTDFGVVSDKIVFDRNGVLEITPVKDEAAPGSARLEVALTVPADVEPVYKEGSLILAFENPESQIEGEAPGEAEEAVAAGETEAETVIAEEPKEEPKYVGEKISIDFQDAELTHVFRLIADISGYNIVVSPDVKGKFSMKLVDVPWDQALDIILRNYGLSKIVEDNIIRIAPTSVMAKEEEDIAKAKESQEKAGDLVTRIYPINYASVEDIKKAIDDAKILTKRGFISTDPRTSSVIIKDVERKHAEYESLIEALDVPTPQVNIDAKIVEVRSELTKDLGIQWGIFWEPPDSRMRIGGVDALSLGSGTLTGDMTEDTIELVNPLMINLPALVGPGKGGNLGLGYINAAATFALDLQLSALESTGKARVVSNPKITTSDNQEAKIMQGEKIPYQTVSQDGTQTQFMDAFLELTVRPHITPEGTVVMNIEAKKNEADFTRQVLGVPTIAIKEVKTQVLINNNDTLVIGGIFTTDDTQNVEAVPGFAELPILGRLFQKKIDIGKRKELLIFITPRIVTPVKNRR
jgi:type IV pilus assembly protein PilQ